MKISVIIPAFNEERLIGETLRQVKAAAAAFARRGWATEIIVCDNNSTDRTAELARAAGATVVFEPVNQIARARNSGAAAATGDWLVFIDADSHPSVELFADVAEQMAIGALPGRGLHDEIGGALSRGQPDYAALEWAQPRGAAAGGVVHFLRGGASSGRWAGSTTSCLPARRLT